MKKYLKNIFLKKEISKRGLSHPGEKLQLIFQIGLLLLIPLLAVMQFYWLGQLSDAEKVRLKANLQISAKKFSEDFDTELTKIHTLFKKSSIKEPAFGLKAAFSQWQNSTQFTSLIDDIYLMEFSNAEKLQIKKYDALQDMLTKTEWPEKLNYIKQFISENDRIKAPLLIPLTHAPLLEDPPAILVDCFDCLPKKIRVGRPALSYSYLIICLNSEYIKTEMIPELSRRYFPEGEHLNIDLAVAANTNPPKVFYISNPDRNISDFAEAEASAEIGKWRKKDFLFAAAAVINRDSALMEHEIIEKIEKNVDMRRVSIEVIKKEDGDDSNFFKFLIAKTSRWEVKIKYRNGSLDNLVSSARNRNLLISYGILLILGLSIIFIFISSRRARSLARRQAAFAANLSHDLRTPLAVIRSAGENIADGLVSDQSQIKKYGRLIRDEGKRLSNMVENTLSFARTQASNGSYKFDKIEINEIILESIRSVQNSASGADIKITKEIEAASALINGDASALKTAIGNLLDNAVKYSDGSKEIKISSAVDQGKNTIIIRIADQGIGIPESELSNIFEPYYRGSNNKPDTPGSGLGLSIVKNIIDAHNGKIYTAAGSKGGSIFTIELPLLNM